MKKKFITMIVIGLFCITSCKENVDLLSEDITGNEVLNQTVSIQTGPNSDIRHYNTESLEEFKKWITNADLHKKDKAFESLIDLYQDYNYILLPKISNKKIQSIFVDSNTNYINYVFNEPTIRVCIEPINKEENEEFNITDITKFMEEKFDVDYDGKRKIIKSDVEGHNVKKGNVDQSKTGYEYNHHSFTRKNIKMKDKIIKCVLNKKYSDKSETENVLSFIKVGMLIKIIYYDEENKEFNPSEFHNMYFEKVLLSE